MVEPEVAFLPKTPGSPKAAPIPLLARAVLDNAELVAMRPTLYWLIDAFLACSVLATSIFAATGMLIVPAWYVLPVPFVHWLFVWIWRSAQSGRGAPRHEYSYVLFSCSTAVLMYVATVRDPVSTLVAFMNMIIVVWSLLMLTPRHALFILGQTLVGVIGIRLVQWNIDLDVAHLTPMPDGLVAAGGMGWLFIVLFFSLWYLISLLWNQKKRNREAVDALEETNVQLRTAERARTELLSAVTHELRTPLVAIQGYVDLMLRNPAMLAKGLPVVKRSSVKLQRLIEELINAAEPPDLAARLRLEPVAVADLLEEETAAFQAQAASLGIAIELGRVDKCFVTADRIRLGQVLSNLLDNALRHSKAGSRVSVAAVGAETTAVISVTDQGRGMSAEELQHIFEPFYTRAAQNTERGGMGLGLSICLRLVTAMNGTIQAESAPEKGANFLVRLPLAEVRAAAPAAPRAARALVLDDEVDVLQLMQATLSQLGFSVDVAQNGVIALDMALRTNYDLVLLDVNVPGLTGVEVSRRMRAAGHPGRIMLFSALIDRDAAKVVVEAGADGFVPKPFDLDALERLVGDLARTFAA